MKSIAKIYVIVLSMLFCLASCIREDFIPSITEGEGDLMHIELFTRLNNPFRTPVSRAADEDGVDRKPWILLFKDNGSGKNKAMFTEVAQSQYNSNTDRSYVLLSPRPQTEKYWVLILANPQSKFYEDGSTPTPHDFSKANLESVLTGKTLSEATSLLLAMPLTSTLKVNDPPFDGQKIPMSYVSESPLNGINAGTTFGTEKDSLELTRSVAKIVVKSIASDFTLEGIHSVYSLNNRTLLHNLSGDLSVATDLVDYVTTDPTNYDFASATNAGSNAIYIYEQAKNSYTPYMIIRGTYNSQHYYYKMELIDTNESSIDFKRNCAYEFTITGVHAPGFTTYEDAKLSVPNNKKINYKVKIIHPDGYENIANAEYYLSVSNRLCLIYDEANTSTYLAFTVVTNCTKIFSNESNFIRSMDDALLTVVSPSGPARIQEATNSGTPVSTDVTVRLSGHTTSGVKLKLGNIEQEVVVTKKDAIPALGDNVLRYYELNKDDGYWWYTYYLSTGLVDSGTSWITLSTTEHDRFSDDQSQVTAEDGKVNIHVSNNTGSSRNGVLWLTTIKNPGYHQGELLNPPRRIKVFLHQKGA